MEKPPEGKRGEEGRGGRLGGGDFMTDSQKVLWRKSNGPTGARNPPNGN